VQELLRKLPQVELEQLGEEVLLELATRRGTPKAEPLAFFSDDDYNQHFRSLYRQEPIPSVSGETVTIPDVVEPVVPADDDDLSNDAYQAHYDALFGTDAAAA